MKTWKNKNLEWKEIKESEKVDIGYKRAQRHNRHLKRKMSYKENLIYFNQLVDLCKDKNINILFVVTPVTQYYREYLNPDYKNIFYNTLDMVDAKIHLLDLFEDNTFIDEDFIDTDHLSDIGSKKLTELISKTLISIENNIN